MCFACFSESEHIFEFVGGEFLHRHESIKTQHIGHRSLHVLPVSEHFCTHDLTNVASVRLMRLFKHLRPEGLQLRELITFCATRINGKHPTRVHRSLYFVGILIFVIFYTK